MTPVTISQVEDLYQELSKNRKADQRKMLANIHEVCAKLVKQGSTPSAASVVKILGTQGYKISTRTIYNKRNGQNPYPILIDAWIEVLAAKKVKITETIDNGVIQIDEQDLAKISDPVLQHKMMIFIGQVRSLKAQNDALRNIEKLPVVSMEIGTTNLVATILSELNREVISNLLNQSNPSLSFNNDGCLIAKRPIPAGTVLSDPGLAEALEAILDSQDLYYKQK
ncbi:gamma-mobile-trio protein GmtX [Aeromonas veronii]|uniref:gamma-mobile-trio protein GmtX n=1 Tax=Aeromonas veronii TaxID=654 RepID=UPI0035BAE8D7